MSGHIHTGRPSPTRKRMCKTCPFRPNGFVEVRELLMVRALSSSPVCHSTGTGEEPDRVAPAEAPTMNCRGARNFQLKMAHEAGMIKAPTDEAWSEQTISMGLGPVEVLSPAEYRAKVKANDLTKEALAGSLPPSTLIKEHHMRDRERPKYSNNKARVKFASGAEETIDTPDRFWAWRSSLRTVWLNEKYGRAAWLSFHRTTV